MRPFKFSRAEEAERAIRAVKENPQAKFIAGGTNLLDLMKEGVELPNELIDITKLPFTQIKTLPNGNLSIGALARNSDTANHPLVRQKYPILTQAILSGASPQIRNMATNGGNLMQRTRCPYFYDLSMPCNKRNPGSGCAAMEGLNRTHAILGWSEKCVAVYPGDMAVALTALDASIKVLSASGKEKSVKIEDFYRLPEQNPEKDNNLDHGDLITSIEIPKNNFSNRSFYLKLRDRASYAFALVSVAAAIEINNEKITDVRIALGGVAHKPWRAKTAEQFLIGKKPTEENFRLASEAELKNAKPLKHNKFKIEMAKRAIVRTLVLSLNSKQAQI
ncbi:MAG: xanthine dehydrogenase family protein subunit M [Pyrinomonadaceae bacterium]|nr:xanthine dehydrogenase family protein subunit M [Pyrinomonadaceae bacterium]MCX7639446.1 xanthine dehydrogenase family protein subunit M [Pyrinomonadaceae bacterium]MDW8304504.1 xanthine dehydrogenase family protein subunit M [Acidobacteriota bacterium]